ncbi:hypothetical protein [Desulfohalovibrio reitneri]|uniref:TIGR03943 family putative permease subunit n=1 Tax=Desulfohalovibrio reitneri TaxID=1307759 RepID=UPI0004A770FE|nr:hypothetical protein [Desulfohalovibrio reitneri]
MSPALRRWLAAAALVGLGGLLAVLAESEIYWRFLNPRFQLLTLITGGTLLACGACLPFARDLRPNLWQTAVLVAFLALAALAMEPAGTKSFAPGPPPGSTFSLGQRPEPRGPSRLTRGGTEYVRLSPPELHMLLDERPEYAGSTPFAMRGQVRRSPALDARGEIALVRTVVVCCFADALAVGMPVRVDDPADYEDGQWLRVLGRLREAADPAAREEDTPPATPGVIMTILPHDRVFIPDHAEPVEPPKIPYAFEVRSKEPFAF